MYVKETCVYNHSDRASKDRVNINLKKSMVTKIVSKNILSSLKTVKIINDKLC